MKKAKIALTAIAVFSVVGSALAFKAIKRTTISYFTTGAFNATATKTLTKAITVLDSGAGVYKYYTLIDNTRAPFHGYLTKGA